MNEDDLLNLPEIPDCPHARVAFMKADATEKLLLLLLTMMESKKSLTEGDVSNLLEGTEKLMKVSWGKNSPAPHIVREFSKSMKEVRSAVSLLERDPAGEA